MSASGSGRLSGLSCHRTSRTSTDVSASSFSAQSSVRAAAADAAGNTVDQTVLGIYPVR
jgi:hypothetical protein